MFLEHKLKITLCIIALAITPAVCVATELDESRGPSEYIHQMLHRSVEVYVVKYEKVVKSTWANGAADKIQVSAKIEKVIRGSKTQGESIKFERIMDGRYGDVSMFVGQSYVVFYEEHGGEAVINPQAPGAVMEHSNESVEYLLMHESET